MGRGSVTPDEKVQRWVERWADDAPPLSDGQKDLITTALADELERPAK